jgi:hypothetical protein
MGATTTFNKMTPFHSSRSPTLGDSRGGSLIVGSEPSDETVSDSAVLVLAEEPLSASRELEAVGVSQVMVAPNISQPQDILSHCRARFRLASESRFWN